MLNSKGVRAALIVFICIIFISLVSMCQKLKKDGDNETIGSTVDVLGSYTLPNGLTIDENFSFTANKSTTEKQVETTENISSESNSSTDDIEFSEESKPTRVDYTIYANDFKTNIEKSFKYSVEGDKATIDSYIGNERNIKIPEKLGGYPVVSIGNGAFSGIGSKSCQSINSVEIACGVERIENKAFSSCTNLNYIKIPGSVEFIGEFAFENCPNLVIKCASASYARMYAIEKNIKYMD